MFSADNRTYVVDYSGSCPTHNLISPGILALPGTFYYYDCIHEGWRSSTVAPYCAVLFGLSECL